MNPWLAAGSLAGVLALAGIAWALRLGGAAPLCRETAMAEAEARCDPFDALDAVVSRDGRAALVIGRDALAIVRHHGASVAARRLARPLRIRHDGERTVIDSGDRMFGRVILLLNEADRTKLLTIM